MTFSLSKSKMADGLPPSRFCHRVTKIDHFDWRGFARAPRANVYTLAEVTTFARLTGDAWRAPSPGH